jgi:hypothetical protein
MLAQIQGKQLGFESESDYESFIANQLIPAAQQIIDNFVGHNFQLNTNVVLKLDGRGKRILMIPPPYLPIISVSSVQIDGVEIVSGIKVFETYLASDTRYFTENQARHQNVQVTLTHGYAAVPQDVSFVAAQLVANMISDMVRRRLMPDTISKAMQTNAETVIIGGMGKSASVFTAELKAMLNNYTYTRMDVTG